MNYGESCGARLLKNPNDDLCDGCYASIDDEKADAVCHFCGESADAEVNGVFVCEGRQCYNYALKKQEV